MSGSAKTMAKFAGFTALMVALSVFLFMIFAQIRTGPSNSYSAIFLDASSLKPGDSVRVAGIRIGSVEDVSLRPDNKVDVTFNADQDVVLTAGTRAAVRYLNLVGDRYLELIDGPGSTRALPPGSQIPLDRTAPALDLDTLLGGLKPVLRGLDPQDVNALTNSLLKIFQGEGETLQSLLSKTSSFTNTVADNNHSLDQMIDDLSTVVATLSNEGPNFSGAIDRLQRLVSELSADRDPIGDAIGALDNGTASIADLLTNARPPLAGTVSQLNRIAPLLEADDSLLDAALQKAPDNFRKLARVGAYGSFVNYYVCALAFRATDLQGKTVEFPWFNQTTGRCAEP